MNEAVIDVVSAGLHVMSSMSYAQGCSCMNDNIAELAITLREARSRACLTPAQANAWMADMTYWLERAREAHDAR